MIRSGPLARPRFRAVWLSEACVVFADQVFLIALTLLIVDTQGAGTEVGLVLAAASAPMAIVLPFGGWIGDRVAPERVLLATNLAQTALTAALAAVVIAGDPPLGAVIALVAAMGAVDGVHYPTAFSFPPRTVPREEVARANALIQGVETFSDLAGPALAAASIAAVGLGGTFVTVAALSLLAALTVLRAAARAQDRPAGALAGEGPLDGLSAGLRHARADPRIRALLLLIAVLVVTANGPYFVGLAALAETRLGGAESLGAIFAAFGAGALPGLAVAARLDTARARGAILSLTSVVIGLGLLAIGFMEALAPVLVLSAVIGFAEAFLDVVLFTWLQESVPDAVLARVMSLVVLAEVVTEPLSFAAAGLLLDAGVTTVFVLGGGLMALAGVAAAFSPSLRRL